MPEATPVTTPVLLTVAIDGAALLHVPPLVASDSVMVPPGQTDEGPVMALTVVPVTVTTRLAEQPVAVIR